VFNGRERVEDVAKADLQLWMNSRKHCTEQDLAGRVEAALAEVSLKVSRTDP